MSTDDTRTDEQKRAEREHRKRVAQLDRIERRMRHPLAMNLLTQCILAGIATMLEKHGSAE